VRLRYSDSPSSLAIANIADQREMAGSVAATPFFTSAAAGGLGTYQGIVLPQASVSGLHRPTLSFSPDDDIEFTRRLFTPISLDGMTYLVRTTWPIATVCRLWLENLNWVSNAETASGPTPRDPPEFSEFLMGIEALQRLQDRRMVVLFNEHRAQHKTDGIAGGEGTAAAAVEAVRAGYEYRNGADGSWTVVEKQPHTVLRVGQIPDDDADFLTFCQAFRLDSSQRSFDITAEGLDPYLEGTPATGLRVVNLETRSRCRCCSSLPMVSRCQPNTSNAASPPRPTGPTAPRLTGKRFWGGCSTFSAPQAVSRPLALTPRCTTRVTGSTSTSATATPRRHSACCWKCLGWNWAVLRRLRPSSQFRWVGRNAAPAWKRLRNPAS